MKSQFISASEFFKKVQNTVYLFKKIWKENTTALLHAPRDVDKTAKAVEIAADITAAGGKVVYINSSDSLSEHADSIEKMENLFVYTPSYASPDDPTDYADLVISGIEEIVAKTGMRIFIIDSLTRIAALSFGRNASPAYVMKRLVALQLRHKLSLLVIAHDSTKSTDRTLLTLADSEIAEFPQPVGSRPVATANKPEATKPSENTECSESLESSSAPYDFSEMPDQLSSQSPRQKLSRSQRRLHHFNKTPKLFVK